MGNSVNKQLEQKSTTTTLIEESSGTPTLKNTTDTASQEETSPATSTKVSITRSVIHCKKELVKICNKTQILLSTFETFDISYKSINEKKASILIIVIY